MPPQFERPHSQISLYVTSSSFDKWCSRDITSYHNFVANVICQDVVVFTEHINGLGVLFENVG